MGFLPSEHTTRLLKETNKKYILCVYVYIHLLQQFFWQHILRLMLIAVVRRKKNFQNLFIEYLENVFFYFQFVETSRFSHIPIEIIFAFSSKVLKTISQCYFSIHPNVHKTISFYKFLRIKYIEVSITWNIVLSHWFAMFVGFIRFQRRSQKRNSMWNDEKLIL